MIKQLGLISILMMWLGTYALLRHHLPDPGKTISQHASRSTRYHIIYGILELIVASLFFVFIFGWFMPTFELGLIFGLAAVIGLIGTFVAALFPDREGWRGKFHSIGAYGMAMSLLVMNLVLVQSAEIHLFTRLILYIGIAYMIIGTLTAIVNTPLYRKNALNFQIIYFLAFHIPIVLAVYL